jgi:hypothetical protein
MSEQPHDRERLIYEESPVSLTRSEWAANVRRGRGHRFDGQRFIVRLDWRRGARMISPVRLVDR